MQSDVQLYDHLGAGYDLLISWTARYEREWPFFLKLFRAHCVKSVLDAACGTGMHARWFADAGLNVTASDPSVEMLKAARRNTRGRGVKLVQATFDELPRKLTEQFDAVTCLGNSLPHVLTDAGLRGALRGLHGILRPGGILVVHNNNYGRILAKRERFMPLSGGGEGGKERYFLRFFDPPRKTKDAGTRIVLNFHIVTLYRARASWCARVDSTRHRALLQSVLGKALRSVGFVDLEFLGSFLGEPYVALESDNLIVIARRK